MNTLIEEIVSKAVYAPSGDNSQPWHFSIKNEALYIYNEPEKDLPFYNYKQCGSLIAHGALIENIELVASEKGLETDIKIFPNGDENELVAIIKFHANPARIKNVLSQYIQSRVTNRKPYDIGYQISNDIKEKIKAVGLTDGIGIKFIDDREKIKAISAASVVNEMTVLKTKEIHKFFFEHIVWTDEDEKRKKSGLFVKTLEMPKHEEFAFKLARFWPFMKFVGNLGIVKKIAESNAKVFEKSSSFIVFLSKQSDSSDFLKLGRSLQRVWLTCTEQGISVHPITGVLFLYQRVAANMAEGISAGQQEIIKNAYNAICNEVGANGDKVLFILRAGKAEPPSAISSKLPANISYI